MKKFLSLLLAGFLLACPILGSAAFSDVEESSWEYEYIDYMEKSAFIDGYEDGTFRPQQTITRAEFAKLLSLSYRKVYMREFDVLGSSPTDYMPYQDLSIDHWAYSYIIDVLPFMNHYSENRSLYFHPDEPITREEAANAIGKTLSSFVPESNADFSFVEVSFKDQADFDPSLWDGTLLASKWGVLYGYEDACFHPEKNLTRAEMAAIFYRYLNLPLQPDNKYDPYDLPIPVDYFPLSSVAYMDEYENTEVVWEIESADELCSLINENAVLLASSQDENPLAKNTALLTEYIREKGGEDFFEENYVLAYLSKVPYLFGEVSVNVWDKDLTITIEPINGWPYYLDESAGGLLYILEIPKDSIKHPFETMTLRRYESPGGCLFISYEIIR